MQVHQNHSLFPYNTFHIDARARQFAVFHTSDELRDVLSVRGDGNLLVLGGGSNILLTRDFDGLVVKNELKGIETVGTDEAYVYIKAQAGENWHGFVLHCLQHNLAGLENLSLIPGNVGASPMQNIGAYGVEIRDVFHELEAFHIQEGFIRKFSPEECGFGYRESVFKKALKDQYIILNVTYRLYKTPRIQTSYGAITQELERMGIANPTIHDVSTAVINIRSSKLPDPAVIGNAGSFFKNPVIPTTQYQALQAQHPSIPGYPVDAENTKVPAGWLIEQAGWKGYRQGDAGCYPKQALVLVNYGNASGQDIYQLSEAIIADVDQKFGISLEREVNVI